jgi:hypothetical protein
MGFAVLHIQKPKGNDSGTTAHIERTVNPSNADPERKYLNRNLIEYPDGVETRTQAIQHRIETAGIKRKISHNQVRALQIMLSGTPEDMLRIQATGKLKEWCEDNIKWLQDTFGKENVVSAVLHLDEKTPHIHATVVPIVSGERRKEREKKKQEDLNTLVEVFPQIGESLRMTQLCRGIGLAVDTIKKLFTGEAVPYSGKLHSQEHDRDFNVQDAKLQLYKEKNNPDKLHLSLNGQNIMDWFKQKYREVQKVMGIRIRERPETGKSKGFKQ